MPTMKPARWEGTSKKALRAFPDDARARSGYEVYRVQLGLDPTDWKPMISAGEGVREIRVRTGREHRLLYVARFAEAVYVLHVFEKKTRKTSRADIEIGKTRYRELVARRSLEAEKSRRK
ncbi:MAG: type II toxin-antitoxin system RelE/ParE family toxin [Deltaproteobacteria bacterium]|nr:type II toxin-antitoxin system RelE/ParE family toxin [Deltaproteobacteria bacterium]